MSPYDIPEAIPVDDSAGWMIPTAKPADEFGGSPIPELANRDPTHNESVLLAGLPIHMASSNVMEIWYNWQGPYPRLFVRFLDGSLYTYNDCSLTVATGMVETMSPGRYVWNVLRVNFPTKGEGPGTYTQLVRGERKGKQKPQVVRLVDRSRRK